MKPLIILSGPTAVGKTELSLELAKEIGAEIISADSMQVYKGMDIGTAKILPDEMNGIKHHLIDIISPFEDWNVLKFQHCAKRAIDEIYDVGKIPIVVGGTGFYIQALLKDIDFTDEENTDIRKELEEILELDGSDRLYEELCVVDPVSAKSIHKNNSKRIIRALEFFKLNGFPFSEHNMRQSENISPYNFAYFVLTDNRDIIYEKINSRVDIMLEKGLVDEVDNLRKLGLNKKHISMQGLGYKEILDYLEGNVSYDEAVYILKRDTRHFAKRQLTWFRREKDVVMIDKSSYENDEDILKYMIKYLKGRSII